MALDIEHLREHYASITDEELLAIDREELVESAQKCIDEEITRRQLTAGAMDEDDSEQERPDWLDEAAGVFSALAAPGLVPGPRIAEARDVLEAAGIPCFLDSSDEPEEPASCSSQSKVWRVMVPGHLNLHASSILDRDIFNADQESVWQTHLETMSDEEVRTMEPRVAFCGLFDLVERVEKAYAEELERRGLKP